MFLNPTQPLPLHLTVPAVSWTVTVHRPGGALLKLIGLLLFLGSFGCGSKASTTKDLVDALACVSYLELCEWWPTGSGGEMGPLAGKHAGTYCESIHL